MIDFWIIKRVGGAGLCLVGWFGWRLPELLTHDAGTPPPWVSVGWSVFSQLSVGQL